tara:strand:+ start:2545 stop:5085 length:2541 start_codon:yes stop_codon:yes gene_type:complete
MENKKIYIYETPKSKEDGYIKIGETTKENVEDRIKEQFSSAALYDENDREFTILEERPAVKKNGEGYSDKEFHSFLSSKKVYKPDPKKEWFELTIDQAISALNAFENGEEKFYDIYRINDFPMRKEQKQAVEQTFKYFEKQNNIKKYNPKNNEPTDYLWNAKMRFGKTFTSYQLMKKSNWSKVLVITYRPAVKKSWRDDLNTHKDFKEYVFLSDKNITSFKKEDKNVVFMSFQDLLKSKDNMKEKHEVIFNTDWDCIIIDEFHYGTSTENAQGLFEGYNEEEKEELKSTLDKNELKEKEEELREEFDIIENTLPQLSTQNRLFLSGTPFKAITSNRFSKDQIFNWTYLDEQREKKKWFELNPNVDKEKNPYYSLPQLNMFIYEISNEKFIQAVANNQKEFSLSHFFSTKNDSFVFENDIRNWLDFIRGSEETLIEPYDEFKANSQKKLMQSKFPFAKKDQGGFIDILNHTFWLLPSISACKAMAKLLKEKDSYFEHYEVLVAAGTKFGVGVNAIPPVEQAISRNKKTITLSCGKLTEGVSIKEWTGILFLTDINSPERYFQTAFRAQTPWKKNGKTIKSDCYVFDFHPSRSLRLLTEYSNKLAKDPNKGNLIALNEKKDNLAEFIRYLPVLKISGNYMTELNANTVMSFDCSNYNSTDLIKAFQSNKNLNINKDLVSELMANIQNLEKCDGILNNIKAYRKFMGDPKETSTIKELGDENKKLEKLKTKKLKEKNPQENKKISTEVDKSEKDIKKRQEEIRELLKVLLGRIPLFMYLTHALEEDLLEVLNNTQSEKMGLFRKATGIEVEDFEFLMNCGLIKSESIDSYIQRFKDIELLNYKTDNELM